MHMLGLPVSPGRTRVGARSQGRPCALSLRAPQARSLPKAQLQPHLTGGGKGLCA